MGIGEVRGNKNRGSRKSEEKLGEEVGNVRSNERWGNEG